MNVHFLPALTTEDALANKCVVVIDVLRATTTLAYALAAGAKQIIPCRETDAARQLAAKLAGSLLGGERGGRPVDGFDLGNSPREYSSHIVRDKTIVFTTTNGVKAMLLCRRARRVLLGSFANLSAVSRAAVEHAPIDILCAGTEGEVTREDVLCAGAIVEKLGANWEDSRANSPPLNDQAQIALEAWQAARQEMSLVEVLRRTQGGRNLIAIGQQEDLETAAQIDKLDCIPVLDVGSMRIV